MLDQWSAITHGPARLRIYAWIGIVALFTLSSFLPDIPGTLLRIVLMGAAFSLIAAALDPYMSRPWRIGTRITLGLLLTFAGFVALFD